MERIFVDVKGTYEISNSNMPHNVNLNVQSRPAGSCAIRWHNVYIEGTRIRLVVNFESPYLSNIEVYIR